VQKLNVKFLGSELYRLVIRTDAYN